MRNVQGLPFLRIILPFLLGLILYKILGSTSLLLFSCLFGIGIVLSLVFRTFPFHKKNSLFGINGATLHIALITLGYLVCHFQQIDHHQNWYKNHLRAQSKIQAKILSPLKETEKTFKAHVEICGVYNDSYKYITHGKAILYFRKTAKPLELSVGDEIIVVNKLTPIMTKGNPGEFDYAAFSQNRGIHDQAFLTKNEWSKLKTNNSTSLTPFWYWHEQIKTTLAKYIPDSNSLGIAQALLTGYRDDIDKEIYNDYTKTGLVHLLAISGLHMGVFYLGTLFLLGLIPFFKKRKRLTLITALTSMWFFALVTTFPPSVQRAGLMISFLVIGQLISRKISSLNFLFASAFLLLLLQPHLLWEVGFQLSYAAVLGILLFYKPLRKWLQPQNYFTRKIWEIMCVSLSAQIFTFPISLYYFHQVPTLFLFTNIIAIPLITIIIYAEVLLVIFSFIPAVAKMIGMAISFLIEGMNSFIHFTAKLSFANFDGIYISLTQCLMLLAIILSLATYLLGKRKAFVPIIFLLIVLLSLTCIQRKWTRLSQEKLIVYNSSQSYLEYIKGKSFFSKDTISSTRQANFEQWTLNPSHLFHGLKSSMSSDLIWNRQEQFDFLIVSNKKILRVKKAYKLKTTKPLEVDYLIISDKWIKKPLELLSQIHPKELIIDGNIPLWKIEDLKSQLQEVDLPTHYIALQGAKTIQL